MRITISNISKSYGAKVALGNLNLTLGAGVYGLLGPNGAGKSTLMRLLCGLTQPTQGDVLFDGRSIFRYGASYRSALGYLPQDFEGYPNFEVKDFMFYMAALKGIRQPVARRQCEALLEQLQLSHVQNRKIKTLSGGMRRRLGIAQSLLGEPRVLILDEPTAGLDPGQRVNLRGMLAGLAENRIILLSTHIVYDIADKIIMLKNGKILQYGRVGQIISRSGIRVWECRLPEHSARQMAGAPYVVSVKTDGQGAVLRLIAAKKPFEGAFECAPNLEDLYLYYFEEKSHEDVDKI